MVAFVEVVTVSTGAVGGLSEPHPPMVANSPISIVNPMEDRYRFRLVKRLRNFRSAERSRSGVMAPFAIWTCTVESLLQAASRDGCVLKPLRLGRVELALLARVSRSQPSGYEAVRRVQTKRHAHSEVAAPELIARAGDLDIARSMCTPGMGTNSGVQVPCGSGGRNHKPKATASS